MAKTLLVDLAQKLPEEMLARIGELTVLFGRLEHMVLLAIKRQRGISLAEAQELYKSYSLGAKLFGKRVCPEVGEQCQNYGAEGGLRDIGEDVEGLAKLCTTIQELTAKRNQLMHGLITTVTEETVLIHNNRTFALEEDQLFQLRDELITVITSLNKLIPIPGLHTTWASGPELDVRYDETATSGDDPIVTTDNGS